MTEFFCDGVFFVTEFFCDGVVRAWRWGNRRLLGAIGNWESRLSIGDTMGQKSTARFENGRREEWLELRMAEEKSGSN